MIGAVKDFQLGVLGCWRVAESVELKETAGRLLRADTLPRVSEGIDAKNRLSGDGHAADLYGTMLLYRQSPVC